ncbi:uncharacterized protein A4U43_C06F4240 [Asparagus officinalis]|uniref:Uncharacterized protein n=1 Tax=Asparagus officinalis TaxID=4686 RepID=A0A5P1EMT2_ASPOF|nr:uncharacterized protein LOC109844407 isoform X2 [Asparagus officinalis]ONK66109.1 uncharacterized protein A4U43_C06F4240 [Asparagus officinalis]
MSSALVPLTAQRIPSPAFGLRAVHCFLSNPNESSQFFRWSVSRVWICVQHKPRASIYLKAKDDEREVNHVENLDECSTDPHGLESDSGKKTAKNFSPKELVQDLKRYGIAGVLSYGLLNTMYYLATFLLVWFYFAPAPGRMGYAAAVERFLKVMAMVWAGSQVTKIIRAGGALALAPFVDKGLSWFTIKFNFESKGKAFAAIAGMCFGLALLLFVGLTLMWA